MEIFTALILLILILLPFLGSCFRSGWLRSLPLPPSPPFWLPLIGHLHLLGRVPHQSLQSLAKKHGSILFLRLGPVPAIVISSGKLAKEVFKDQDLTFASRPYFLVGEEIAYKFMGMSVAPYNNHWRTLRKLYTLELFTARRIESFLPVRLNELNHALSALVKSHEEKQPVDMRNLLTNFSFNVMSRILMNRRYFQHEGEEIEGADPAEAKVFKKVLREIAEISLQFHISEFVPSYLRWIDWSVYKMRQLHAVQDKFLEQILDEHKRAESSPKKDFMDLMLEFLAGDPKRDHKIKAGMTELMAAGSETSVTTIEWAFAEMLTNPNVLEKAHQELDNVVGSSQIVEESDIPQLTYLQAIVKETFRLHPPVPLLVPRMSMHDTSVGGYHVPKGSTTIVNAYSIGRDPALWDDPLEFRPERFIGRSIDVKGQHFELIPFGAGRRACPGMGLALKTVHLALASMLQGFDWKSHETVTLEEHPGSVSWLKTPLKASVSPRIPVELLKQSSCQTMLS